MGRPKRYRERLHSEMESVRAKSIQGVLSQTLKKDYGCSRIESTVLAARSSAWLPRFGASVVPGQVSLWVPTTQSRRFSRTRRAPVTINAVSVAEDTEVWQNFGLVAMQQRRLVRWLYEIFRQGGWGSLKEIAAWANLTPTALAARLESVRTLGVWLPHVGGPSAREDHLALKPWLLERYLKNDLVEPHRENLGITQTVWEETLRQFAFATATSDSAELTASETGLSRHEVLQMRCVAEKHRGNPLLAQLFSTYLPQQEKSEMSRKPDTEHQLIEEFDFSPLAARLYSEWLKRFASCIGCESLEEGQLLFLAISSEESAKARLEEAEHVPVHLSYFTPQDAKEGPYSELPTRVSELKFRRIERYATEARSQGALLTIADLSVLMGIHSDAIRRQLTNHPDVVVPTRGRVKDIGRSPTHRAHIVELYLQIHTETEIVERTGHSYESVEAYLREFARVLTLADRGMNGVMIRRVTGRSMALVKAYLELYAQYDTKEHYFRLAQLRNMFTREEFSEKKGGPLFRSPTEGGGT